MSKQNGVWITGDIHGDVSRFDKEIFFEQKDMQYGDENYVIICGDMGLLWDYTGFNENEEMKLDYLNNKPFITLFVDGNHENFDRLNDLEVEEWHGGKVHKLRDNVIHLMRGQVFDILGRKFFTFGGAQSHDIYDGILELDDMRKIEEFYRTGKVFRINHVSWWADELPTKEEMEDGWENLEKNDFDVDVIITHAPPSDLLVCFGFQICKEDQNVLSDYLMKIRQKTSYKYWFCGHMHRNQKNTENDICLYEQIIKLM